MTLLHFKKFSLPIPLIGLDQSVCADVFPIVYRRYWMIHYQLIDSISYHVVSFLICGHLNAVFLGKPLSALLVRVPPVISRIQESPGVLVIHSPGNDVIILLEFLNPVIVTAFHIRLVGDR